MEGTRLSRSSTWGPERLLDLPWSHSYGSRTGPGSWAFSCAFPYSPLPTPLGACVVQTQS